MTSMFVRGGAALALAGLAALVPTAAHATADTATRTAAVAQETQRFTGSAYENSPKKAKREAETQARHGALLSGFLNEQCVLLFAESYRLAPGYYGANAAISCTR
ncbi:hypothetical protein SAMN05216371_7461 [Streptomyces sp. TLI_053]|uniref:hypothetical protein n=1 Tax=Streptomyces sp. TLI_053 TaxID=1855352 RepID=UPI00087A23C5|nr:hypothetical protein [Streptomyces sp. TLI_053]SDT82671.1 hypothetical protein SAMN05216371_7461 [Streptomyces sp. TLI_053]